MVFEIAQSSSSILVEGGIRRPHAERPFAFEIEIPFNSISVVSSEVWVRSAQTGELTGKLGVAESDGRPRFSPIASPRWSKNENTRNADQVE